MKWDSFQNIFIFGDSYSSISLSWGLELPTPDRPFGVEWPGITSCEEDHPNYIGYLHEMLKSQYPHNAVPFVYNYAHSGDTVEIQLHHARSSFAYGAGKKPEWAPWTSENSLFIIEIGINNCGRMTGRDMHDVVKQVFDLMDIAYEAGARQFILTDVPPLHRFPGMLRAPKQAKEFIEARIGQWNLALGEGLQSYAESHSEVCIKMFSMQDFFTRLLDDPSAFGFKKDPENDSETLAQLFCDHVHPTTAVHGIIAREVFELLA